MPAEARVFFEGEDKEGCRTKVTFCTEADYGWALRGESEVERITRKKREKLITRHCNSNMLGYC